MAVQTYKCRRRFWRHKGIAEQYEHTLLCFAAVCYCGTGDNRETTLSAIENWLSQKGLNLHPSAITKSILDFYGRDYTFSVPILSMLVVCGVIPKSSASGIPALPFEFTLLPQRFYRFVNLRVVSYALPALIGVGIYLHRSRRKSFPGYRMIRERFVRPAIDKLRGLVPASGGFLEAIPLTGFVVMCLIAAGESKMRLLLKDLNSAEATKGGRRLADRHRSIHMGNDTIHQGIGNIHPSADA